MPDKDEKISRQTWVSAAFLLIFSAIISKVFGFVREILIARNFGISSDVDAFLIALSVPLLAGTTIGVAFSYAIVPVYHKLLNKEEAGTPGVFIKAVFSVTLLISAALMAVIYFFPGPILNLIAPAISPETLATAVSLLKWLVPILAGVSLFNVLSSVYNAIHHFKIPALTDMFSNVFVIAALVFLSASLGIYALLTGMLSAYFFVLVVFIIHLSYHGIIGFSFSYRTPEFRNFLSFVSPILVFIFFLQFSSIIENYFASMLKEGSVASLGYAKRLYDIIPTLLIANIARAVFPTFSSLYSERKITELREMLIRLNKQFIIYFLPITFVLIFFRKEIITVVYLRGAFDQAALEMTSGAFMYYAVGLMGATLVPVFFRLCYAFSDSISPMVAIAISTLLMVVANYFLSPLMGISGIALSSSLAILVTLALLGFFVRKKIGGINLIGFSRMFLISAACASFALLPFLFIPLLNPYYCILFIPAYFILYLAIGLAVAKKEYGLVWQTFKKTIGSRANT